MFSSAIIIFSNSVAGGRTCTSTSGNYECFDFYYCCSDGCCFSKGFLTLYVMALIGGIAVLVVLIAMTVTVASGCDKEDASFIEPDTEAPPMYESLYRKVKATNTQSTGLPYFFKRSVILAWTIGCIIFLGIALSKSIAMIHMGVIHLDDCPAERYIPIYLVVAGSFWSFFSLMKLCLFAWNGAEETEESNCCEALIMSFIFALFIAGNVMVYRTNDHFSTDPNSPLYCDQNLYFEAFTQITVTNIMLGIVCCCSCIFAFCLH